MNKKKALVTLKYIIISSIDLEIYKTQLKLQSLFSLIIEKFTD
jgi:hypothetical protein